MKALEHMVKIGSLGIKYADDCISQPCQICGKPCVVWAPEKIADSWHVTYAHSFSVRNDYGKVTTVAGSDRCRGEALKSKADAQIEIKKQRREGLRKVKAAE